METLTLIEKGRDIVARRVRPKELIEALPLEAFDYACAMTRSKPWFQKGNWTIRHGLYEDNFPDQTGVFLILSKPHWKESLGEKQGIHVGIWVDSTGSYKGFLNTCMHVFKMPNSEVGKIHQREIGRPFLEKHGAEIASWPHYRVSKMAKTLFIAKLPLPETKAEIEGLILQQIERMDRFGNTIDEILARLYLTRE